jgi:hypothetical protein
MESAWIYFRNPVELQQKVTAKLFKHVKDSDQSQFLDEEHFIEKFAEWRNDYSNSHIYGGIYDNREIEPFDPAETISFASQEYPKRIQEIYSKDNIQMIYQLGGYEKDIELLEKINSGSIRVKSFQYAGVRHERTESSAILEKVKEEHRLIANKVHELDKNIFLFFFHKASKPEKAEELIKKYETYFKVTYGIENHFKMYADVIAASAFFKENTPMNQIKLKIYDLKKVEDPFKKKLAEFFAEPAYSRYLSEKEYNQVENYLSANLEYFQNPFYSQPMINLLFNSLNAYLKMVSSAAPQVKRELLDFQMSFCEDEIAELAADD